MKIRGSKDFYSGLLFIFFGLLALVVSRSYPIGTAMHMGPRYFPTIIGGVLALLGFVLVVSGLLNTGEESNSWVARPIVMVLASVVAFALMIRPLGLVLATLALVVISCLGLSESRLRDIAILSLLLTALAVVIFIYGVGLPLKVWPI
jgi:hypothetical protein